MCSWVCFLQDWQSLNLELLQAEERWHRSLVVKAKNLENQIQEEMDQQGFHNTKGARGFRWLYPFGMGPGEHPCGA